MIDACYFGIPRVVALAANATRLVVATYQLRKLEEPLGPGIHAVPVDHLADIATALHGERRVPTRIVLARLAEHNTAEYEHWTFSDLKLVLSRYGFEPRNSDGVHVVRADDVHQALTARDDNEGFAQGAAREAGSSPHLPPRGASPR